MEANQDVYIRRTRKNGRSVVTYHRTWDANKFLKHQQEEAQRISTNDPSEAYTVSLASELEYKQQIS